MGDALYRYGKLDRVRWAENPALGKRETQWCENYYDNWHQLDAMLNEDSPYLLDEWRPTKLYVIPMNLTDFPALADHFVNTYSNENAEYVTRQKARLLPNAGQTIQGGTSSHVHGTLLVTHPYAVNVRVGNSESSNHLRSINPNESFPCVGNVTNGWYNVVLPSGETGFVSNKLSKLTSQ